MERDVALDDHSLEWQLAVATEDWRAPAVTRRYDLETVAGEWRLNEERRLLLEHGYVAEAEHTVGGGQRRRALQRRPKRTLSSLLLPDFGETERYGGRRTVTYRRATASE